MILIKEYKGIKVLYDSGPQYFVGREEKDGVTTEVCSGKTQADLEEEIDKYLKAQCKGAFPIPAIKMNGRGVYALGQITSMTEDGQEVWFTHKNDRGEVSRGKERLGQRDYGSYGCRFYAYTPNNALKLAQIDDLKARILIIEGDIESVNKSLDGVITKEAIEARIVASKGEKKDVCG